MANDFLPPLDWLIGCFQVVLSSPPDFTTLQVALFPALFSEREMTLCFALLGFL